MQYRNLFLVSNAAHLVPPTGAKEMNLALYDVDVLAHTLVSAVQDRERTALDNYSDTCLPHVWTYQEFSSWMTDTMHDAGDPSYQGVFSPETRTPAARYLIQFPSSRAPA